MTFHNLSTPLWSGVRRNWVRLREDMIVGGVVFCLGGLIKFIESVKVDDNGSFTHILSSLDNKGVNPRLTLREHHTRRVSRFH